MSVLGETKSASHLNPPPKWWRGSAPIFRAPSKEQHTVTATVVEELMKVTGKSKRTVEQAIAEGTGLGIIEREHPHLRYEKGGFRINQWAIQTAPVKVREAPLPAEGSAAQRAPRQAAALRCAPTAQFRRRRADHCQRGGEARRTAVKMGWQRYGEIERGNPFSSSYARTSPQDGPLPASFADRPLSADAPSAILQQAPRICSAGE